MLSAEENCSDLVEPPNDLELNHAVTQKMSHLFYVVSIQNADAVVVIVLHTDMLCDPR